MKKHERTASIKDKQGLQNKDVLEGLLSYSNLIVLHLNYQLQIITLSHAAKVYHGWEKQAAIGCAYEAMCQTSDVGKLVCQKAAGDEPSLTQYAVADTQIYWQLIPLLNQEWLLMGMPYTFSIDEKILPNITLANRNIKQPTEQITDLVPGNIYWKNKAGVYLGANAYMREQLKELGISGPIVGKRDCELWPKQMEQLRKHDKQVMSTRQLLEVEEKVCYPNGKVSYFSVIKSPLYDHLNNVIGVIGISIDISVRRKLEKDLLVSKLQAEAASRSKSEFIANMSHDIRTPITGMLAMADHMLQVANESMSSSVAAETKSTLDRLIATIREDAPLLSEATYALLNLCNDILDVVQLESGKAEKPIETFDLRAILPKTVRLLKPVAQDKQLELSLCLAPAIPHHLIGVRLYLERIVLNLASNALKFTEKGFVKIGVGLADTKSIALPPKPGDTITLALTVEDSGLGIPQDKQKVIFENFSRLTPSYSGVYKGAGLGLYTVKRYVEAMAGDIQVESAVGKGSCFTITVPLKVAAGDGRVTSGEVEESDTLNDTIESSLASVKSPLSLKQASSDLSAHSEGLATSARAHVLVVEDNAIAAIGLQMKLKQLHCIADVAKTGAEAVRLAKSKRYDCILMDVGLPDFSGIEATKKIRAFTDPKYAEVPIAAVTGHIGNTEKRQVCFDVGMQAVLSKPAELLELKPMLNTYVFGEKRGASVKTEPVKASEEEVSQSGLAVIDWPGCVERCEGNESVVREMLSMLVQNFKTASPVLAKAYADRDMNVLHAELHCLGGGVGYLKLPELEHCLNAFQKVVDSFSHSQEDAQLELTYAALKQAIANFERCWEAQYSSLA